MGHLELFYDKILFYKLKKFDMYQNLKVRTWDIFIKLKKYDIFGMVNWTWILKHLVYMFYQSVNADYEDLR